MIYENEFMWSERRLRRIGMLKLFYVAWCILKKINRSASASVRLNSYDLMWAFSHSLNCSLSLDYRFYSIYTWAAEACRRDWFWRDLHMRTECSQIEIKLHCKSCWEILWIIQEISFRLHQTEIFEARAEFKWLKLAPLDKKSLPRHAFKNFSLRNLVFMRFEVSKMEISRYLTVKNLVLRNFSLRILIDRR